MTPKHPDINMHQG